MGRITGSASIETLVRVGIEKENGLGPESKMVVLHDFTPCVDDELEVKRGQIVNVLYQENDWVYVISETNMEGFIPHSYCAQYGSQLAGLALNVKKKLPRQTDPNQVTVLPPTASSNGSTNSANGVNTTVAAPATSSSSVSGTVGLTKVQQQRFGSSAIQHHPHPIPDVLNPANAMIHKNENDPNMTSMITNASRVNATGLEHSSDTDSFQTHFQSRGVSGTGQLHHLQQIHADPSRSNSLMSETSSQPDIHPFFKVLFTNGNLKVVNWKNLFSFQDPSGRYVVLYSYSAQDENDLSVERGQCVTVLNSEDPDWFWVSKFDGTEGFVPSGFIYPLDAIQRQRNQLDNFSNSKCAISFFFSVEGQQQKSPPNKMVGLHHSIVGNLQATHPVMMTNGLPNPALMGNFPPSSHQMHKPPPWSGGSAAGSSGPPSFSSHLQSQMTSLGSPNDVGLLQPSSVTASGQAQQPPKPLVSPGPPPPPPAPPVPPQNDSSKSDFQYNGTELVMLYDYKVSFSI